MMNKLLTEWRKFLKEDEAVDLSEPPTSGRTTTNRSDSPLNIPKKEINFYSSDTNEQQREILAAADYLQIKVNPDEIISYARQALDKAFLNLEEATLSPKNQQRLRNFAKSKNLSDDELIEEIKKLVQGIKKRVIFLFGYDIKIVKFIQSFAKTVLPNKMYNKIRDELVNKQGLTDARSVAIGGRYVSDKGEIRIEMALLLFKLPNLDETIFHEILHAYDFDLRKILKSKLKSSKESFGEEQGLADQLKIITKETGLDLYYHSNHELFVGIKKLQRLSDKNGITTLNQFKTWLDNLMMQMKKEEEDYIRKNPGPFFFESDHSQPDIYRLLFVQLDRKNPKFYEVLWNTVTRIAKVDIKPETGIA